MDTAQTDSAWGRFKGQAFGKFAANPLAWILFALLLGSMYFHYRTGDRFEQACLSAKAVLEDASYAYRSEAHFAVELDRICSRQLAEVGGVNEYEPR